MLSAFFNRLTGINQIERTEYRMATKSTSAKALKAEAKGEKQPPKSATPQLITETIEKNYMPYVMSVIISRAIPEIDGFKPSQRKLLYMMYKMGLMTGARTKSANVVGATMKLNPHGDQTIYETLVRLTRGNESLLHPFIDSKGSFGKQYSSDMAFAAPRYTEVKLDAFCGEIFAGIDKNAVDFLPNYDNTMTEPVLLPTTFPNILVSPNLGIAVGISCTIASFNLGETCDAATAMLRRPKITTDELLDIMKAPDFAGGAQLLYDRDQLKSIYETGRGSLRLRAKYVYNKKENCIEILEIPYSTSIELIMKKLTDLIKDGKLKEVSDFRDEIDLNGFKLTLDLRRDTDPDKLMAKLFKLTPLEDTFSCNFNVLIDSAPRQIGVREILEEWIKFRMTCFRRESEFELNKKRERQHLLIGLGTILLDIDKAIAIVRNTEKESMVVPNLTEAFGIDEIQAEYIAEIKLRHLNREYILERLDELENLQKEIAELTEMLSDELKIKARLINQLAAVKKKYALNRKTEIIYNDNIEEFTPESFIENYTARFIFTREGYFKKITLASLRGNDVQTVKDGDEVIYDEDGQNTDELLFFTNHAQAYRAKAADFDVCKASQLGDFVGAKLKMEDGERAIMMCRANEYNPEHNVVFIFENGKGVRVPMTAYQTKSQRKKLTSAFSSVSPIVAAFYEKEPFNIVMANDAGRAVEISTKLIPIKATRSAGGVQLFAMKAKQKITAAKKTPEGFGREESCRRIKIPATGTLMTAQDAALMFGAN